jgi:hypothetical protein
MRHGIATSLLIAICSASLAAQATLSVSPGPLLQAGSTATIGFCDPSKAGQSIDVRIDDGGFPTARIVYVKIQLDKSGEGTTTWKVQGWLFAAFNAPGANEVIRGITP